MAKILQVLTDENPKLREECRYIFEVNEDVRFFVESMKLTMQLRNAVGLAANQVGWAVRMIVMDGEEYKGEMINPKITYKSEEKANMREGCLSIPDKLLNTGVRSQYITVEFKDLDDNDRSVDLSRLDAVIAQHEIDHLDGILMTDYVEE